MSDRVAVIGAGSWGTAVGTIIGASHPASLWVRSPELAASMAETRQNEKYLPDVQLPDGLTVTSSLAEALQGVSIVFMAVPSHGFRAVLTDMQPLAGDVEAVVSLAKGIEMGTNLRMSQVVAEVLPGVPAGVLTGPNLAREVAQGHPAACVVALSDETLASRVQALVHTRTFRTYMGTDVVGCEIAGATKNVMAIAAGIGDGLGLGDNTRAVLITRGWPSWVGSESPWAGRCSRSAAWPASATSWRPAPARRAGTARWGSRSVRGSRSMRSWAAWTWWRKASRARGRWSGWRRPTGSRCPLRSRSRPLWRGVVHPPRRSST